MNPPRHGGGVLAASAQFGIPPEEWLDLSTGINPDAYPVPAIPEDYFRRLPETDTPEFNDAVRRYYGGRYFVAAGGSQRFIEVLPRLRPTCRVAVPDVGYREHAYHWRRCGHHIVSYNGFDPLQLEPLIEAGRIDVAVLINPCNPTGARVPRERLEQWRDRLDRRGGWLIIDEAFIDPSPGDSAAAISHRPGVVVLRSLGKFFGLAGIRVGFAMAGEAITQCLAAAVGPWAVTGPSMVVATQALADTEWQQCNRERLHEGSAWLADTLQQALGPAIVERAVTPLFVSLVVAEDFAQRVFTHLAESGILVRLWPLADSRPGLALLRFGLVGAGDGDGRRRVRDVLRSLAAA